MATESELVDGDVARHLAVNRLEALTDGVFAIAITLLSIEIAVPLVEHGSQGSDLREALTDQWPSYAAYVVTFFLIGAYWVNHHRMFNLLRGVDHTFLLLNIFFLMAIAIMPFINSLLAEYMLETEMRGVATAVYGIGMLVLAVAFNLVWWYAFRRRLFKEECHSGHLRKVLTSYLSGPMTYGFALAISLFWPVVALIMFVLVPFGYFFEGPVAKLDQGYLTAGE